MNRLTLIVVASLAACSPSGDAGTSEAELVGAPCDWPQIFGTAQHAGRACPEVTGMRVAYVLPQDPDADAENEFSGFLQIHEPPPLTSGDFVVVPGKSGYVDSFDRSPEAWSLDVYRWLPRVDAPNAVLKLAWSAKATWQPVDSVVGSFGSYTNGYVAQFAPAVSGASLYVPARHGRVRRMNLATGALVAEIDPLAGTPFSGDELTVATGALSVGPGGDVYYTATAFPLSGNRSAQPRASWLVHVRPDGTSRVVLWTDVAAAAGLPGLSDPCEYPFRTGGTPPATGPGSRAPIFGCGVQRPAMNSAVAVTEDGSRLVAFSYANNAQGAAFLVTLDAAAAFASASRSSADRGRRARPSPAAARPTSGSTPTSTGRCASAARTSWIARRRSIRRALSRSARTTEDSRAAATTTPAAPASCSTQAARSSPRTSSTGGR